jgi:hypothetical protein
MQTLTLRRLSLPLLLVAVAGVALAIGTALAAVVALDRDTREMTERTERLRAALADIQAAQDAFLETGSVNGPLLAQTAARLREVQADALRLTRALRVSGATPDAAALVEAADALGAAVDRGHDNLTAGRDLMAADLLLSGTEEARGELERRSGALRAAEASAGRATRTAALVRAWAVFSAAALAGAILLILRGRATAPDPVGSTSLLTTEPAADLIPSAADEVAVPVPGPPPPEPVDLEATAELCTAIGRMAAATELPGLLARTADGLRASGVVVWMKVGDALVPLASHGFDQVRFGTLGPVGLTDANATAAAWRTARTQIVAAGGASRGAVAVPMRRPDGCVGVLAVELDGGREHDAATAAVTAIVAAQFASVLSAEPAADAGSAPPDQAPLPVSLPEAAAGS